MRTSLQCPGDRISCPSCGQVVMRASMRGGNGFFTCSRKVGHARERRTCSAHMYVHCTDRLCTVLQVSKAFHDRFEYQEPYATHEEILAAYGETLMEKAA